MASSNFRVKNGAEITEVLYVSGSSSLRNVGILGPVDPDVAGLTVHGDISATGTIFVAGSAIGSGGSSSSDFASGAGGSLNELQYNNSGILDGAAGLNYNETLQGLGIGAVANEKLTVAGNISSTGSIFTNGNITVDGAVDGRDIAGDAANVVANSASWDSTYSSLKANSAEYESTFSTLLANSAEYESVLSTTRIYSADWTYVAENSAGASGDLTVAGRLTVGADEVFEDNRLTVVGNISALGTIYAGGSAIGGSGTAGNPAGANKSIQYNDSGALNGGNFFYDESTERVGIGTSSPNKELTVIGSISAQDIFIGDTSPVITIKDTDSSGDTQLGYIQFTDTNDQVKGSIGFTNASDRNLRFTNNTEGDVRFLTNSAVSVAITSAGNVGIGTTTPGEKLTVSGNISANGDVFAKSVIVDNQTIVFREADGTIDRESGAKITTTEGGSIAIQASTVGVSSVPTVVVITSGGTVAAVASGQEASVEAEGFPSSFTASISTLATVFASGGDSRNWNSTYSNVNTNSADWTYVAQNSAEAGERFKTIALSANRAGAAIGADIVADTASDTITLCAGPNIQLVSDPSSDTVMISSAPGAHFNSSELASNSASWNDAATNAYTVSADIAELAALSANWNRTESSMVNDVVGTSANWNTAYTHSQGNVTDHADVSNAGSGQIITSDERDRFGRTWTNLSTNSSQWAEVKADIAEVAALSATWNDAATNAYTVSADIAEIAAVSANWNTAYTRSDGTVTVHSDVSNAGSGQIITTDERDRFSRTWTNLSTNSSQWAEVKADIAEVAALSARYTRTALSVETNVVPATGSWNSTNTTLIANSARYDRTALSLETNVVGSTANWNESYITSNNNFSTLNSNSARWDTNANTEVAAASADWNYTAANTAISVAFDVTNNGSGAYRFNNGGFTNDDNPTLHLQRGKTYRFRVNASGHPFLIKTQAGTGTSNQYLSGVSGAGAAVGNVDFEVRHDAPRQLFYQCQAHSGMVGAIHIGDATATTEVFNNSANWNTAYTTSNNNFSTLNSNSARWDTNANTELAAISARYTRTALSVETNVVPATGSWNSTNTTLKSLSTAAGTAVANKMLVVDGSKDINLDGGDLTATDVTVQGNLTVQGATIQADTVVTVTSALSVTNTGTGPALHVEQTGNNKVVEFLDDGVAVFSIANGGNITVKDNATVDGRDISVDGITTDNNFTTLNSNSARYDRTALSLETNVVPATGSWNSTNTTLVANSAGYSRTESSMVNDVATTSANWNTAYTRSDGVVTIHSDVSNAGSGQIITTDERDRFGRTWTNVSGTSANWNTAYTHSQGNVTDHGDVSNAGSGQIITTDERDKFTRTWTNVSSNSARRDRTALSLETNVVGNSANWNTAYTHSQGSVTDHNDVSNAGSGQIITSDERDRFGRSWTNLSTNSSQWAEVKADIAEVAALSASWNDAATNAYAVSADVAEIAALSANWNRTESSMVNDVVGTSANWNTAYTRSDGVVTIHSDVSNAGSGQIITTDERDKFTRNWTNVSTSSASWNDAATNAYAVSADIAEIAALSARWNRTESSMVNDVVGTSANWNTAYTHSQGNVTDHGDVSNAGSGQIITTDERDKFTRNWTNVSTSSASWNDAATNAYAVSADIAEIAALSASWTTAYNSTQTELKSNSADWNYTAANSAITLDTSSHNYLSISNREITLGEVDISDDTNLAANAGVTLTGDTLSIDSVSASNFTAAYDHSRGNVTDHGDVSNAGSGQIITADERDRFGRAWTNVSGNSAQYAIIFNSSEIAAASARYTQTALSLETNVVPNTADWNYVAANSALTLDDVTGNGATTSNNIQVGDATITGDLTVQGATIQADTVVTVTSALSVTNTGTGPALHVEQKGNNKVVEFLDDGTAIFSIANGGAITVGTWNGTAIANDYVAALPTSKITSGTFANARIASSNVTQHQGDITGTGALNSGSITSGFGNINNGTSSLTTGAIIAQQLRVTTTSAPSAYTTSGTKGDVAYDTNYLYICVSNNSWRRVALAIWE